MAPEILEAEIFNSHSLSPTTLAVYSDSTQNVKPPKLLVVVQ